MSWGSTDLASWYINFDTFLQYGLFTTYCILNQKNFRHTTISHFKSAWIFQEIRFKGGKKSILIINILECRSRSGIRPRFRYGMYNFSFCFFTIRTKCKGVPQGSVLSPLLFSIFANLMEALLLICWLYGLSGALLIELINKFIN